jgi:hypothetical protein
MNTLGGQELFVYKWRGDSADHELNSLSFKSLILLILRHGPQSGM